MAVYPDRIVLKNSTDGEAAIVAAIQPGGADEIQPGEIVLGLEPSTAKFYTRAGDGSIVSLGGTGTGSVTSLSGLSDVNVISPLPSDGDVLAYDASTSLWIAQDPFAAVDLGDLNNVDLTVPATDGQYLRYDSAVSAWKAFDFEISFDTSPTLGGDLGLSGYYLTDARVSVAPSTGEFVVRGGSSEGSITLNCTANTHGVTIQSPPHSAAATYTLTLPTTSGIAGQALIMTDGSGQLEWAAVSGAGTVTSIDIEGEDGIAVEGDPINTAGTFTIGLEDSGVSQGTYIGAQLTIDRQGRITSASNRALELNDVNNVEAPLPADGQALVYASSTGDWRPQTLSGTGTVTSIEAEGFNGISVIGSPITTTGKLDINLDDTGVTPGAYVFGTFEIDAQGRITSATDGPLTTNGDLVFQFAGQPNRLAVGGEGQALVVNGGYPSWQDLGTGGTVTSVDVSGGIGIQASGGPITNSGTINLELAASGVTPGFYSNASVVVDERGRVISAQAGDQGVPVILASSAPTGREDGSALQNGDQWLDTNDDTLYVREESSWTAVSGGGGGGAVDSVNGQTGVVNLGLNDLSDVSYTSGVLAPNGLDKIAFSSSDVPGDEGWEVGASLTYGVYLGAFEANDVLDGSYVFNHPQIGIALSAESNVIRLMGALNEVNQPELRWESRNPFDSVGNYFGLKLPAGYSVNQTYTLPLVDGTSGQMLSTDGNGVLSWATATGGGGGGGGVTEIIAGAGIAIDQPTGAVTISATGGGSGGGSGAGIYLQETQVASGGAADFVGLGYSGILQKVASDLNAWIVLYASAAERTADAGRAYSADPAPGSGVLFEAYVTAGGEVIATPGTTYMNSEAALTEAVYAAVRDQSGAAVDATVTFSAYGLAAITAVSGGTFGSGL